VIVRHEPNRHEPNPYERPAWRAARDGLMRPGGLELTDHAIAMCGLVAGSRVLDVGCGLGATVAHLVERHGLIAAGIDTSEELLDEARRRVRGAPFYRGSGHALPDGPGTLDAILAECSWSGMSLDQEAAPTDEMGAGDRPARSPVLEEFRRALRPGGWLILSDLYARGVTAGQSRAGCGLGRLRTEAEIRAHVTSSGFMIRHWEDHSDALRHFAAQWIFEHGSLDGLWDAPADGGSLAGWRAARPGYFLMIARKAAQ
jgi:arsenite methyltransferase